MKKYFAIISFAFVSLGVYGQLNSPQYDLKFDLGDYNGAIQICDKDIQIKPTATAYYLRGRAKFELKDYSGAMQDYNKSITLNPNDFDAHYYRGLVKYTLEDYRGANEDYTKAIQIKPTDADTYMVRALTKYELNDYTGVVNDCDKTIALKPTNLAYFMRGIAKIYLKEKNSGCLDLSKAGEMGNDQAYELIKKHCN